MDNIIMDKKDNKTVSNGLNPIFKLLLIIFGIMVTCNRYISKLYFPIHLSVFGKNIFLSLNDLKILQQAVIMGG